MLTKRKMVELEYPVAILDAHTMPHPKKPGQLINVDERRLQQIADNNNRRVRETGDECPIVVGHTQDGVPEKFQPEVIGYARDFKVRPLFNTGRKAIFSRWRVYVDKLEKLLEYPRRSVELWLGKWEVDPISLLGATTPDRDLGLIRLSRPNDDSVTQVFGEDAMDPQQLTSMIMSQLMQSPQMQFLNALMEQVQSSGEGGPPEEEGPMGEEEMPPDEGEQTEPIEEEASDDEGPIPGEEEEEPIRRSAGYSSGTDTFTPSGLQRMQRQTTRQAPVKDLANNPVVKQLVAKINELQDANNETAAMNQALLVRFARSEREKDLIRLQAEDNIDLDIDEELNVVAPEDGTPMATPQYQGYLEHIKRRYQRAPVNQDTIVTASGRVGGGNAQEQAIQARDMALDEGITFEKALAKVRAQ